MRISLVLDTMMSSSALLGSSSICCRLAAHDCVLLCRCENPTLTGDSRMDVGCRMGKK